MQTALQTAMRAQNPLVVNYANFVTPGFVANGLNEIGASPIMTGAKDEAADLMAVAGALVLNLGTIRASDAGLVDALAAAAKDKPIVLDPVAVGATNYRFEMAQHLLASYPISYIRGNAGEIAKLAGVDAQAKGIDAGTTATSAVELAKAAAAKYHCTVIVSGVVDVIASGDHVAEVSNQTPLLPAVVGSGDLLSSITGAFAALTSDGFAAAQMACATLATAGELAATGLQANAGGTFAAALLDELGVIDAATLDQHAKVQVLS